jgi:hypothetical protein
MSIAQEVLDPEKTTLASLSHADLLKLGTQVETEIKSRSSQLLKMAQDNLGQFTTKQLEDLQEALETELEERPEDEEDSGDE